MDLSLVQADELIEELDKRFDTCIFLSHKFTQGKDAFDWHLHGNKMTCIGLLELGKDRVKENFGMSETGGLEED